MPDNVEVLRRNVHENGMEGKIDVVWGGVWDEPGYEFVYSKGRQRNSLVPLPKLTNTHRTKVPVMTLDQIVSEWSVNEVDLVYMSINGAENEAIKGLNRRKPNVHRILIETPYERNGVSTMVICKKLLEERGYRFADYGLHFKLIAIP